MYVVGFMVVALHKIFYIFEKIKLTERKRENRDENIISIDFRNSRRSK